ncbi:MAG: hypothetical protein HY908_09685 [Myxococcales bacterium]|nr:hypothetical protein [Myxococcales bacterium]
MKRALVAVALGLAPIACGPLGSLGDAPLAGGAPVDGGAPPSGLGTDDATTAVCLGCHADVAARWQAQSAHRPLYDCNGCHGLGTVFPHGVPAAPLPCARCHSETSHPAGQAACTGCHDPHGSDNLFLVRRTIMLPGGGTVHVHFSEPEGASADGLVRAGVAGEAAGTGLCEVCHTATAHYDAAGAAAPHETAWCATCHGHQAGFAPGTGP